MVGVLKIAPCPLPPSLFSSTSSSSSSSFSSSSSSDRGEGGKRAAVDKEEEEARQVIGKWSPSLADLQTIPPASASLMQVKTNGVFGREIKASFYANLIRVSLCYLEVLLLTS
ncbi:hypothetical protein E2C01_044612 [Portunus trituberculatus]|uniref:Uncharacterized protein n=1 Tax=Portunus trituberculatus TaxID=210409 RepID=A0A5B7G0W2_PORTR|nr:hypothetical protein [Portunus trituberculatus]